MRIKSLVNHVVSAVVLHAGIGMVMAGDIGLLKGSAAHSEAISQGPLDPIPYAAMYETAASGKILVIGLLLIVLGGFIHARMRIRDERNVPITIKPKEEKPRMFFMEVRL